jgi:ribosome-binding factor A
MTSRRISRKDLLQGCDQVRPGDGSDPRYDRLPGQRPPGRKTLQLCGQVAETLAGVLAEQGDDVLRDLMVVRVTPAGGGRLLVLLTPAPSAAVRDRAVLLAHLANAHGNLRAEVARAVHRRKAPDLVFELQEPAAGKA